MSGRYPTIPKRAPPKAAKAPKKRVANVVLAFGFVFLTAFTVVMTVGFFVTGTEAPTLVTCVYSFWGAELVGMLVKRIFDKKNVKEDTTDD